MKHALRILPAVALVAISMFGAMAPAASATILCPPSPTPGSTLHSNIEVTAGPNPCVLDHVTVDGSVTVDSDASLFLQNGAVVTGGITIGSGASSLQVAFGSKVGGAVTLNTAGIVTIASSTLSHGLSGTSETLDILSSTINGAVSVTNAGSFFLCGSQVAGPVQSTGGGLLEIGDRDSPDPLPVVVAAQNGGPVQVYFCAGNTIAGSLTVNGGVGEIEANKIGGAGTGTALTVTNVFMELEGNTVRGSAVCTGDTLLGLDDTPPEPSNIFSGKNNGCPL